MLTNHTDFHSDFQFFFELAKQFSASTNSLFITHSLLAPPQYKNDFLWSLNHDQTFQAVKECPTVAQIYPLDSALMLFAIALTLSSNKKILMANGP